VVALALASMKSADAELTVPAPTRSPDRVRVVSLLPAATEIVAALGRVGDLVGVSHECDHPPEVASRPRVTHCEIHGGGLPSEEIDRWVANALASTGTLYTLDEALVRRLAPDRERAAGLPRCRCVLLEWIAPPYRSGHWDPELVEIAGGSELLGRAG